MPKRQPPPSDEIAEKFILGSLLLDGSRYADVTGAITLDSFSVTRHQLIWQRMTELAENSETINYATVAGRLQDNRELNTVSLDYLVSLTDAMPVLSDANLNSYIAIVVEKYRLRKAVAVAQKILAQAASAEYTANEISLNGQAMLADQVGGFGASGVESVKEFVETYPGGVNTLLDPTRGDRGIPTGLRDLDEVTDGFHATEIFLIGARPSHGKTCLGACIAKNIARTGNGVAVFTLELGKAMWVQRLICEDSYVSFFRFRKGELDDAERQRVRTTTNEIMDLPLYIDDTSGLRVADMRVQLNRILRDRKVQLIIADYVQLLRPPKGVRFNTENDKFTLIGEELKALTKETGIPLLLLSQLNRESERDKGENRPKLSQCRGAGIWEEISFVGSTLYREYLRKRDREELRDVAQLFIEKNRSGPVATINLKFTSWLMRFANSDTPAS